MSRLSDLQDEKQLKEKRPLSKQKWLLICSFANDEKRFFNLAGSYPEVVLRRNRIFHSADYTSCWLIQKSSAILSS